MKRAKSAESEGIIMNKQPKYKIDNAKLTRLVTKAQNGSQKALEEVINMVSGYLYYYSLTLLGDEEQAKDAVQDILLTVLKKLNTLADPKAFLGWLKTITSNYCKTKLSRAKDNVSLDEGTWEFSDESDQICPEKSAEADEVCAYVKREYRKKPSVLGASVHEKVSGTIRRRSARFLCSTASVNAVIQSDSSSGTAKGDLDSLCYSCWGGKGGVHQFCGKRSHSCQNSGNRRGMYCDHRRRQHSCDAGHACRKENVCSCDHSHFGSSIDGADDDGCK